MYQGKRLAATPKRRIGYQPKRLAKPGKRLMKAPRQQFDAKRMARSAAAAVALCTLAFTGAVDLSTAYLHDQDSVDNAFILGSVAPEVTETFTPGGKVKENVFIQNGSSDSDVPVYIRALWIISWKDAEGRRVLSPAPKAEEDYTFSGPEEGWAKGSDGYYYYTQPVQPGGTTAMLIRKLEDKHTDTTRQLCVDVIAQAVQASPAQAVGEVFRGVSIDEHGILTPPGTGEEVAP